MLIKLLFCSFSLLFFQSCVVGFSNAENHVPLLYSKIYVPAANDSSVYAGNSSRLSSAIRNSLSNRSDIELTSLEDARFALQVKVVDRKQSITAVDSCNNAGTPYVANGAFSCAEIHPELVGGNPSKPASFNQPAVSPTSESLYLVVEVKAIDLNNGKILWAKRYFAGNIPASVFNEIGDNGDGLTRTYMANKPDMHGLRYQEAVDNAVQTFSNVIAADIQGSLFSSLPIN